MLRDIAGHPLQVGDLVAYNAKSSGFDKTRLYIVHSINISVEDRNHHMYDKVNDRGYWEMRPTEMFKVKLRGFKYTFWEEHTDRPVKTYIRTILHPKSLVKVDRIVGHDPNNKLHNAIFEWLEKYNGCPYIKGPR